MYQVSPGAMERWKHPPSFLGAQHSGFPAGEATHRITILAVNRCSVNPTGRWRSWPGQNQVVCHREHGEDRVKDRGTAASGSHLRSGILYLMKGEKKADTKEDSAFVVRS